MRFVVPSRAFLTALKRLKPAIPRHGTLEVLHHVHAVVEGGRLTLTATNLESTVSLTIKAPTVYPGQLLLPYDGLVDFLGTLTVPQPVTVENQGSQVLLIAGHGTTGQRLERVLRGMDPSEFPAIAPVTTIPAATFRAAELMDAIDFVAPLCATDNQRPIFTGVHLELLPERAVLVGADKYRLGVAPLDCDAAALVPQPATDTEEPQPVCLLVPHRIMAHLADLVEDQFSVRLTIGDTLPLDDLGTTFPEVQFTWDTGWLKSQLIAGTYPNWRALAQGPEQFRTHAVLDVRQVDAGLRSLGVRKDEYGVPCVALSLEPGNQGVAVTYDDQERSVTTRLFYPGVVRGEGATGLFNAGYLREAFKLCDGRTIISANGPNEPILLRPTDHVTWQHIIMPVIERDDTAGSQALVARAVDRFATVLREPEALPAPEPDPVPASVTTPPAPAPEPAATAPAAKPQRVRQRGVADHGPA